MAALQSEVKLKMDLAGPLTALQDTARRIAEVQGECKLPVLADEFVESFKPTLMDVIFSWSKVRTLGEAQCQGLSLDHVTAGRVDFCKALPAHRNGSVAARQWQSRTLAVR